MHKILVLWGTPRSTSTAFEWMMRMRGDMACFHEPFGEAWYQGDDAKWPRLQSDSPRTPGLSSQSVWDTLKAAAAAGPVFSKDFPQYVEHMWTDEFLNHFNHSFLIRDPAKVLTSVYKNWPEFDLDEIGFQQQRSLYTRLTQNHSTPPPVIDSDDLLENPHGIVKAWCEAVGIPFISDALSWDPGSREEVLWYDKKGVWHANLQNSDGLKPQPRRCVDISQAPDWLRDMYQQCLPHYQYLHARRLQVPPPASGSAS